MKGAVRILIIKARDCVFNARLELSRYIRPLLFPQFLTSSPFSTRHR